MTLTEQFGWLLILAIPVACICWTLTHEEVFREAREYCQDRSKTCRRIYQRKFFYALTCEYCMSHYVSAAMLAITRFQLLLDGWRGYFIALFALVWIANCYMSLYGRLRLDIKAERIDIALKGEQERGNYETQVDGAAQGRQGHART